MGLLENIEAQPAILNRLAREWFSRTIPAFRPPYIIAGMGSSLFASYPAWLQMVNAGVDARLWDASELLHYGVGSIPVRATVVLVSQSGATAEIVALMRKLSASHVVVGVTNEPSSELSERAHWCAYLGCPHETLATTVTYLATMLVMEGLAGSWCHAVSEWQEAAVRVTQSMSTSGLSLTPPDPASHLVFLGRGPSLASAWQSALMFKEVVGRGSEAMSAAAFRHGPLELAGPRLHAVIFMPQSPTVTLLEGLADDLELHGSRVDRVVTGPMEEELAPLVNILPVQILAEKMARQDGRQPGQFRIGASVTRTE